MKNKLYIFLATSSLLFLVLLSCKKHNPEDPWLPHFRHLNKRLEGEWELVKFTVDGADSSAYLDIDTMLIARFFKFEPLQTINSVEGSGSVYIKSKAEDNYTERVGACPSEYYLPGDDSKALVKLSYKFREGTKEGEDFFKFGFSGDAIYVNDFEPGTPVFKPFNTTYKVFNNFYYRPFYEFNILKATNNKLVLFREAIAGSSTIIHPRYRLEFKKIK